MRAARGEDLRLAVLRAEGRSVHHADVLDALRAMPDNSFHGCLTDPPYGLSFMGHQWDHGVPSAEVWREVLRVLRPGAHLLAFGGTRTFHRLTCAIEDAGFEIRDCMSWLYGSGFPKSLDVSKAIDREAGATREVVGPDPQAARRNRASPQFGGSAMNEYDPGYDGPLGRMAITAPATEAALQWSGYGSALKPAWEPVIVARKPLTGTLAANCQEHGCGGLAIDACRVGTTKDVPSSSSAATGIYQNGHKALDARGGMDPNIGRWPANVILDEEAGAALDAQSGTLRNGGQNATSLSRSPRGASGLDYSLTKGTARPGDSGGASRFFYCAKASRAERDAGLEGFAAQATSRYGEQGQGPTPQQTPRKPVEQRNVHPTVKPLALTTYLARLILPPVEGTRLLVPFCGSGSEMIGGLRAGWSHVEGIDSWDVAVRIARARLAHAAGALSRDRWRVGSRAIGQVLP